MIRSTPPSHRVSTLLYSILALWLVSVGGLSAAQLGEIDFPNTGSPEAQEPFIRAVLLLHSFEYTDAREAFQEAQALDAGFALAYWGEAMTHNHPLWRKIDIEAATEALAGLAPTHEERIAKTATERERGYLAAVEALIGPGEKGERDRAYSAAMERLSRRYPDDNEAKAFWALSILGTQNGTRDFATYMRAGAIAEEVFADNPLHPGAAHYMIHSYDDPVHAPLGLRAARVYAGIAPAASHAQHMISHIFVALGEWEDSVESNLKSFEVSRERAERKDLDVDQLNYHSLQWLQYSYLQLGRIEEARKLLDEMHQYAADSGSDRARSYHAYMRASWVVETGRDAPGGHGAASPEASSQILDHYATTWALARSGDGEKASKAFKDFETAVAAAEADEDDYREADREQGRILQKELRALLEFADGEHAVALSLLEEAATAEAALPLDFGPPSIVKPSHELYGEMLLELERPDEARTQFEAALARAPRRTASLSGLAQAARALGDSVVAERMCDELAEIRASADAGSKLPAACGS